MKRNTRAHTRGGRQADGVRPTRGTHHALIKVAARRRALGEALGKAARMRALGVPPTNGTYVVLVTACLANRQLQQAVEVSMKEGSLNE